MCKNKMIRLAIAAAVAVVTISGNPATMTAQACEVCDTACAQLDLPQDEIDYIDNYLHATLTPEQMAFNAADYLTLYKLEMRKDGFSFDETSAYNHYITIGKNKGFCPNIAVYRAINKEAPVQFIIDTTTAAKAMGVPNVFIPTRNTLNVLNQVTGWDFDIDLDFFMNPGSERVRELLKDIPMDEQLREVVIRIGDNVKWNATTKYNGWGVCEGYYQLLTDIVYGEGAWHSSELISHKNTTIQQYDGVGSNAHIEFVLYVDPNTGHCLLSDGNVHPISDETAGHTRTGWADNDRVERLYNQIERVQK